MLCWKFKAFQKVNDGKWESFKTQFLQKAWGYCWDMGVMALLCRWGPSCSLIKGKALVWSWKDLKGSVLNHAGRLLVLHCESGGNTAVWPFKFHWFWAHRGDLSLAGQLNCLPSGQEPSLVKPWLVSPRLDVSPVAAVGHCNEGTLCSDSGRHPRDLFFGFLNWLWLPVKFRALKWKAAQLYQPSFILDTPST